MERYHFMIYPNLARHLAAMMMLYLQEDISEQQSLMLVLIT